ncbi:MAG: chitobiase/beta-hexosaminidase C-terminal domain-containing protein, partial [Coriobacteriia bacterium]|nr:chitobiase/beta-hexosaminidase C-terminal domain-containing protein [Coriobacteriia bacterium]
VSGDGTHTLLYAAVDAVGNREETRTATIRIDTTAPGITDDAPAGWVKTPPVVRLAASDDGVGVAEIRYSLDSSEPTLPYADGILVSAEGVTVLRYQATDSLGNTSEVHEAIVLLDSTPPSSIDNAPTSWVASDTTVSVVSTDALSGVERIEYSLDGSLVATTIGPIEITGGGVHALQYRAIDVAGNTEETRTATVRIDATAPVTTSNAAAGSYTATATISLAATDTQSGVALTKWRLNGSTWTTGTSLTVPGSLLGTNTIEWFSTDAVGNTESIRRASVRMVNRYEQDHAMTSYTGTWSLATDAKMSAGSGRFTSVASNTVDLAFSGTTIEWIGPKGPSYGLARVTVNGTMTTIVDLYAPTLQYQQSVWSSGLLADGVHRITIESLGQRGLGTGTGVNVDAFDVVGTIQPRRFEQSDSMTSYSGTWSQNSDGSSSGGTYRFSSVTSSTLEVSFWGKSIDLVAIKGGSFGIAKVTLDGVSHDVDLYNNGLKYRQVAWSSGTLTEGRHTLRVEVSGTK